MNFMHKAALSLTLGTALLATPAMADSGEVAAAVEADYDAYLDELIAKMAITGDQAKEVMRVIFAKNRY